VFLISITERKRTKKDPEFFFEEKVFLTTFFWSFKKAKGRQD